MWNKPQEPPRLGRVNPAESMFSQDLVIRISFTTLILLAFVLFLIICFVAVPATGGVYWW